MQCLLHSISQQLQMEANGSLNIRLNRANTNFNALKIAVKPGTRKVVIHSPISVGSLGRLSSSSCYQEN